MSKKVLLAAPESFGLYKLIVKNLEFLGYEVVHIEDRMGDFKYKSVTERLYNVYRKIFLNDRSYKEKLRGIFDYRIQVEILDNTDEYEFVLVIRADFFDTNVLKILRSKTNQMISFHYDGVSRDLSVLNVVHFFDKFYVFDPVDVIKYPSQNFLYSPNFYFDFKEESISGGIKDCAVYYVSSYHESRENDLIKLHEVLTKQFSSVRFLLVCKKEKVSTLPHYIQKNVELIFRHVSFEEQISFIRNAQLIVDLVISDHNGFSLRIFEGIKYRKKVITTNRRIIEADFYHPNNFFVLSDSNFEEIPHFLELPYVDLGDAMRTKYGFTNWLNSKINNV